MAVTVTTDGYNLIDAMDDDSPWTATTTDVTDFYKEGSQCVGFTMTTNGNNDAYRSVTEDLSSTPCHIRFWFMTTSLNELNTDANGGVQVYLSDGSNTGYWYAAGSTTYTGGWMAVVVDVSAAVDAGTKPSAMNAITTFGIRVNLTSSPKKTENVWIDHICALEGLVVYGDDSGGYFDFSHIQSAVDNTSNGWPIMTEAKGIYFYNGGLTVGDASGSNGCKFQAKSQRVIFEDRPVSSDAYAIEIVDNGTGTTEFILGDKSGTAPIQGCLISVEDTTQSTKFTIDANTDTDVDNFKLYATTFYGGGSIKFANNAATTEVIGCSFEACAQVEPDDCTLSDSFFINTSDADAALLWNGSISITDCGFFANTTGAAIEMLETIDQDFDGLSFSGNTNDVLLNNGTPGTNINISKTNGSDPTSYENASGNTATITYTGAAVTTAVHVNDHNNNDLASAQVWLRASDGTGDLPFEQSISSITRSGTTATANFAAAHGLKSGDYLKLYGITDKTEDNAGAHQVTYSDADTVTYTTTDSGSTNYTGTITGTGGVIYGTTDANGDISRSRVFGSDQPYDLRVAKASASPRLKVFDGTGTIDNADGESTTVGMVIDE